MFQQFIAIIRGSYYLRSYSFNICVVDVYGLQFVQCGQLLTSTQLYDLTSYAERDNSNLTASIYGSMDVTDEAE
jgi:hypothetical protein